MRFYLHTMPYAARREELESGLRLAGSDPQRFRRVLDLLADMVKVADDGDIEGICFGEQHFDIEGVPEVATNPILFGAHAAAHSSRLKIGQLGLTLSANHPIRIAEDVAMLDQISGGRAFFGFTRGNATRWVNVFAKHFGTAIATSDKSAQDEMNMRAIEEALNIILLAWKQQTFNYQGEFWQVPAPNTPWGFPITERFGAGMAPDGTLDEVGITPRPLQEHLRIFSPLGHRLTTARIGARLGGTAVCYTPDDGFLKTAYDVLTGDVEEAGVGHLSPGPLAPGAFLLLGRDQDDVDQLRADFDWLMDNCYRVPPFGVPNARYFVGTPDQVSEQIEQVCAIAPFEEIFLWNNAGYHDEALAMRSLELLVDKIVPRFS